MVPSSNPGGGNFFFYKSKDNKIVKVWKLKFLRIENEIWLSSKSHFPSLEKSNFHSCKKIQFEEKLQV